MPAAAETRSTRGSLLPMRLRVIGSWDPRGPTVLFGSRIQTKAIPLRTSLAQAEALEPMQGKAVEVTARVRYDDRLEIVDGELIDWAPLRDRVHATDALRTVFLSPQS